ncbi:FecR family protein [Pontimicrobium sp. MEBiC06410]
MKNEKDILKWLDNELSNDAVKNLKQIEDFEVLEKIAHYSSQMQAPKVDAHKLLEEFKVKHKTKTKTKSLNFARFYKYAALLIVALTAGYFIFNTNNTNFNTAIAETEVITLPDNSIITLNAVSKLSYNAKEWEKERHLNLEGEAFFKVSKGQSFTVDTNAGVVKVLGTQFNVKERKNYFEVQCYEGSVSVTYNKTNMVLTPGKSFRVVNGNIDPVSDFKTLMPSWLNKESTFVKVPLEHVITELENYYDINIITKAIDKSILYSGSFSHTNKEVALQAVTIPLKLSYKIDGNTVTFYKYESE